MGWPGALAGLAWRDGGGLAWAWWLLLLVILVLPATSLELASSRLPRRDDGRPGIVDGLVLGNAVVAAALLFALGWRRVTEATGLTEVQALGLGLLAWLGAQALAAYGRVLPAVAAAAALCLASGLGLDLGGLLLAEGREALPLLAAPRPRAWLDPSPWAHGAVLALASTGLGLGVLPRLGALAPEGVSRARLGGLLTAASAVVLALGALGAGARALARPTSLGGDLWTTSVVLPWLVDLEGPALLAQLAGSLLPAVLLLWVLLAPGHDARARTLGPRLAGLTLLGSLALLLASATGAVDEPALGREALGTVLLEVGLAWSLGLGLALGLLLRVLQLGWARSRPSSAELAAALLPADLQARGAAWIRAWLRWLAPSLLLALLLALLLVHGSALPGAETEGVELGALAGVVHTVVPAAWLVFVVIFATTRRWLEPSP